MRTRVVMSAVLVLMRVVLTLVERCAPRWDAAAGWHRCRGCSGGTLGPPNCHRPLREQVHYAGCLWTRVEAAREELSR